MLFVLSLFRENKGWGGEFVFTMILLFCLLSKNLMQMNNLNDSNQLKCIFVLATYFSVIENFNFVQIKDLTS